MRPFRRGFPVVNRRALETLERPADPSRRDMVAHSRLISLEPHMPASDLEPIIAGFRSMQSGWNERTTPDDMRADFERWCERFPDDREASITRVSAGGVPADQIEAPGLATSRVVLYFHGGGYSIGSARSHRGLGKRVAFAARARVVLPDYRLAPEHVFPAAVEDAVASYRGLLAAGIEPEQIAVAVDSA